MINEELKTALLREHARDKRLTLTSYILILILVIILAVFLGRFLLRSISDQGAYVKIVFGGALLGYFLYGVFRVYGLFKKEKQIEAFLQKIEGGAKATSVVPYREYKMIIPLGKITYKMWPVEYQKCTLDCEPAKVYSMAVNPGYAADFKNFVSGASLDAIDAVRADLYTDETIEYDPAEDVPVRSAEEFREFLNTELGDTVKTLDATRKTGRSQRLLLSALVVVMFGGLIYYMVTQFSKNPENAGSGMGMFVPVIIFFAAFYIVYMFLVRPRQMRAAKAAAGDMNFTGSVDFELKNRVLARMVEFANPGAQYMMHGHIGLDEALASGMFPNSRFEVHGSDLIVGRHKGVPFQFCDLSLMKVRKVQKENEQPDYSFVGQFFIARFNKSFSTPVFVLPKNKGVKGFLTDDDIKGYVSANTQKVTLEDPEFMDMFNVYATDQLEARYILSTSLMERIKELAKRTEGRYNISFYDNRITVANNNGSAIFGRKESKSLVDDDYKLLVDFYRDFCDQLAIIDDLKLNIKIWR